MRLGGIAFAAVVSALAVSAPVRGRTWIDSPEIRSVRVSESLVQPDSHPWHIMLIQTKGIPRSSGIDQPEGTPFQLIAQQQRAGDLRELIRRYNSDLSSSEVREIARWTEFYSQQYSIDPRLIAGLVARESGFDPKATSRTGARGLGQISATLGKDLGIRDRYDIQENLEGTTRWIRTLYDTWRADGIEDGQAIHWSLASYRQGLARTREIGIPTNVARYINEVYDIANGLPHPASR